MRLLWVLPLLVEAHNKSFMHHCAKECDCQEELSANCTQASLRQVPKYLPPLTEHLDLSHNQLTQLPRRAFVNTRHLKTLLLNDNNISRVADGAFSPLESLLRLDLRRNRLTALSKGFTLGMGSLRELLLSENQLTSLDSHSFQHLDSLLRLNLSHNFIHLVQVRAFGCLSTLRQLYLESNRIQTLSNGVFTMLKSLEVLHMQGNNISHIEIDVLTPLTSLALLNLAWNQLSSIHFKTFLSLQTYSTHILLEHNPWYCDCDLQRVFRKLRSVRRLMLDDYDNLSCAEPLELKGYLLNKVAAELCIAEMVTVLIITIAVLITVVAAILMAERKRKRRIMEKHWTDGASEVSYDS